MSLGLSSDPLSPGLLGDTLATGGARPPIEFLSQAVRPPPPPLRLPLLPGEGRPLMRIGMGVFLEDDAADEAFDAAEEGRAAETALGVSILVLVCSRGDSEG